MIIDGCSHGYHGKYLDILEAAGGDWAKQTLTGLLRILQNKPQFTDVALRVEMLDRNGIASQVVTPELHLDCNLLPGEAAARLTMAKAINNNMARLMEDSKGKLLAIGGIPLMDFEHGGPQEMERAIKGLGLKGMNIPTNVDGKPVDSQEFEPFWAKAAELNIPVFIHPRNAASPVGRAYEAEYDLMHNFGWPFETTLMLARLVFSGVMERYPSLKVVSHHLGGGMIPFFWGRIRESYASDNLQCSQQRTIGRVLPKPLYDYFSKFFYDTAVGGNEAAIKCAYEVFGADQIVFATDAPYGPGTGECRLADYPNVIKSMDLPDADKEKIFEGNIRKVLNFGKTGYVVH